MKLIISLEMELPFCSFVGLLVHAFPPMGKQVFLRAISWAWLAILKVTEMRKLLVFVSMECGICLGGGFQREEHVFILGLNFHFSSVSNTIITCRQQAFPSRNKQQFVSLLKRGVQLLLFGIAEMITFEECNGMRTSQRSAYVKFLLDQAMNLTCLNFESSVSSIAIEIGPNSQFIEVPRRQLRPQLTSDLLMSTCSYGD